MYLYSKKGIGLFGGRLSMHNLNLWDYDVTSSLLAELYMGYHASLGTRHRIETPLSKDA